jgi:hypothetical protein
VQGVDQLVLDVLDESLAAAEWWRTPDGLRLLLALLSALLGAAAPMLMRLSDAAATSCCAHYAPAEACDAFAMEWLGALLRLLQRVHELEATAMSEDWRSSD